MAECGNNISGIWLPVGKNELVYHPLKCNRPSGHAVGRCFYFDQKSGMMIVRQMAQTMEVTDKGYIVAYQ